ncbi:Ohr family peroxiredoxin [Enterococcus faecalis]|nr:Ohr family peroxiredoxin [Enterococcus faecalis]
MKKIYETTIINTGGRAGEVHSPDKSFSYAVASPGVKKENTTNPEQLFAAAYSACFNGALELVMDQEKVEGKSTVTARVSLFQGEDGFSVGDEVEGHIDEGDEAKAEEHVKKAYEIWTKSKATRNKIDVKLTVM